MQARSHENGEHLPTEARGRIRRMEMPSLPTREASPWKRIAIISFFSGFGVALAAALVLTSSIWYKSRPTPPKPWNTSALVVTGPPSFSVSKDGKLLELEYSVKNSTNVDFKVDDNAAKQLRIMLKLHEGELSPPIENKGIQILYTPIFIPAGQKGTLGISVEDSTLPTQTKNEAAADYHERLRTYLETSYPRVAGIVLYDEINHYQLNLPKWADKKPAN